VRQVWIAFSESFPAQALFTEVLRNLRAAPAYAGAP